MTDKEIAKIIGKNLKELREKHNFTKAQMGAIIKRSESTVYAYETGRQIPTWDMLENISNIFKINISDLMKK